MGTQKKNFDQNVFYQNFLDTNYFGQKNIMGSKTVLNPNSLEPKFVDPKFFWNKKFFDPNLFFVKNHCGPTFFYLKIFDPKFSRTKILFGQNIFGTQIFFGPKLFWTLHLRMKFDSDVGTACLYYFLLQHISGPRKTHWPGIWFGSVTPSLIISSPTPLWFIHLYLKSRLFFNICPCPMPKADVSFITSNSFSCLDG